MDKRIEQIVQLAGKALEQEDRLIRQAILANRATYPGVKYGIAGKGFREHDYQYIVWRSLLEFFPYIAEREEENHNDLILRYPDANSATPFTIIEMKNWWGEEDSEWEKEVSAIKSDIDRKLVHCRAEWGIEMVFSANLRGKTEYWLNILSDRLGIMRRGYYSFPTYNVNNDEIDFWVAVFIVKAPSVGS